MILEENRGDERRKLRTSQCKRSFRLHTLTQRTSVVIAVLVKHFYFMEMCQDGDRVVIALASLTERNEAGRVEVGDDALLQFMGYSVEGGDASHGSFRHDCIFVVCIV